MSRPHASRAHADALPQRSVLVVDHDPWASRAIVAALAHHTDLVLLAPAHSGEQALESRDVARPDIVVVALNLPGTPTAVDLIAELLTAAPAPAVVVLTTTALGDRVAGALRAGAAAIVHKSVSESALREIILLTASGRAQEAARLDPSRVMVPDDPRVRDAVRTVAVSPREREILTLICRGYTDERIAVSTGLSVWTVKSHAYNLRAKFQVTNRSQLILRAIEQRYYVA